MFGLTGNSRLVIFKIISIGILVISTIAISESHHQSCTLKLSYVSVLPSYSRNIFHKYTAILYYHILSVQYCLQRFTGVSKTTGRKLRRKNYSFYPRPIGIQSRTQTRVVRLIEVLHQAEPRRIIGLDTAGRPRRGVMLGCRGRTAYPRMKDRFNEVFFVFLFFVFIFFFTTIYWPTALCSAVRA